jgi:hypothetical protein
MMDPELEGREYTPYRKDYPPEEYADFESAEDRGDIEDLAEGREPCELCGGHLKPRGAFGAKVVFECLGCSELMTIVMDGWGRDDDEDDDDEEEEGDDEV